MADQKLNEVTKVTDMAYVPVIMADGSIGQIAKADLASVVAGQMRANSSYPYMFRGFVIDANGHIDSGCYRINSNSQNTPTQYGILVVDGTSDYILQHAFSAGTKTNTYVRMYFDGSWNDWQQL